jgi:hypothetical protein
MAAGQASAGKKASFALGTGDFVFGDDGGGLGYGGVHFGPDAQSYVEFSFQVPRDYKPGTTIQLIFSFFATDTPCALEFIPGYFGRSPKKGHFEFSEAGPPPKNGSNIVSFDSTYLGIQQKKYIIDSSATKPGDYLWMRYYRQPSGANDTCYGATLVGLEVKYKTKK